MFHILFVVCSSTVDGTEVDPGVGLRQSVDAMKQAFDQCINYVAMVSRDLSCM